MKTSSLAAALVVGLSMGSQAYGQRVLYELRGEAWGGAENRIQQSATDLLGLEPSGVVSVPMVAKFLFDRDTAPRVVNGSLAGDGQFEYEHALLDASISMNGVCFGLARPPVPDDYRLEIVNYTSSSRVDLFSLTFQARDLFNTYTVPVEEFSRGQFVEDAVVRINSLVFNVGGAGILDDATIPATTDFFDVTPYRTMGVQVHTTWNSVPPAASAMSLALFPALAELPTFTVKTDPLAPTPRLTINGIQNRAAFPASAPTSVKVALDAGDMADTCGDWWILAETQGVWFSYLLDAQRWVPAGALLARWPAARSGLISDLPAQQIANTRGLPPGRYSIYFGLDTRLNGRLDLDAIVYDVLVVDLR